MYWKIKEKLAVSTKEECLRDGDPFTATLLPEEWNEQAEELGFGAEREACLEEVYATEATINYSSLTGAFYVPDRYNIDKIYTCRFAIHEKCIIFIDDSGMAGTYIVSIANSKRKRKPSLENFIYDFLQEIISDDLAILENYETLMTRIEGIIQNGEGKTVIASVNSIRGELLDYRLHYEQLEDLSQELAENENDFFKEENLKYFRIFNDRLARLKDKVSSLRDYTVQLRDFYQTVQADRQNQSMQILTVVSTIFLPLTLIAGWYGMNFTYMPELQSRYGYVGVTVLSILVVAISIYYFKKKKML